MRISARGLLTVLGLWGIASLATLADAQAPPAPLPGGTPPISGTPPLPARPPLPPVPGTQPSTPPSTQPGTPPAASPGTPGQPSPSMILTAPPGPDAPVPGTGAAPLQPTTLQQLPREFLPAPDGIRPFARPTEAQQVLTMDDAVKIALDNQPLILARVGDYQAELQNIAIALAPQLPQLSGQWNGFWNQTPSSVQSPAGQAAPLSMIRNVTTQSRSLTTSATVTAQQLLWDFGKTLAATDAARAGAKSSAENVEIQKQETVRLVKEGYYGLALSNRLVQVSQAQLDRALVNLRSAKGFFDVGTQPKSAVTRAEVDVATAQLSLIQAVNNVNIFRLTINQLMGIPINTPTEILDNLAYEHVEFETKNLLNEAFARRPEYRQIKAQYDQADFTVKQQFRNFFPNVVAQGTFGSARPDMNETYSYGLQLNWSIFDGGGKIALYKQAQAQRDAAQARVRDTELTIWQQVERAYVTVQQAEEAIGAAEKGVESADENFRLSQGRFDAGVANIIELTDAQLALTNAQATVAQALAAYRIAIAQLERFMGRR
jgi:outer membrane protein